MSIYITIINNPVNDPPRANDLSIVMNEDSEIDIRLLGGDVDGDNPEYPYPNTGRRKVFYTSLYSK